MLEKIKKKCKNNFGENMKTSNSEWIYEICMNFYEACESFYEFCLKILEISFHLKKIKKNCKK